MTTRSELLLGAAAVAAALLAGSWFASSAQEKGAAKDEQAAEDGIKRLTVKAADLDDLVVKTGKLTLNNFSIAEKPVEYRLKNKAVNMLELSGSIKSKAETDRTFGMMVAGLDDKGDWLWSLSGTMGADPSQTGAFQINGFVPGGTLKKTATMRFMFLGDL